jgi:hypothetical protein
LPEGQFITDNPNYSPKQAKRRLALPRKPKYRITIQTRRSDYNKAPDSLPFNRAKPKFKEPGLGKEYILNKPAPIVEFREIDHKYPEVMN